ncbi:hypothetical protein GEMRC1_009973 [Eukaryota sp. GEM-RC1]
MTPTTTPLSAESAGPQILLCSLSVDVKVPSNFYMLIACKPGLLLEGKQRVNSAQNPFVFVVDLCLYVSGKDATSTRRSSSIDWNFDLYFDFFVFSDLFCSDCFWGYT